MYLAPPAATWSRLRSTTTSGQPPLRSRAEPLGLSSLNPNGSDKVIESNIHCELVCELSQQVAEPAMLELCRSSWKTLVATCVRGLFSRCGLGKSSTWSVRVTCYGLGIAVPARRHRPAAPSRGGSHEPSDVEKQTALTLAPPGSRRRATRFQRPSPRVVPSRASGRHSSGERTHKGVSFPCSHSPLA